MFQGREPTWGEAKSQLGERQRWDEGTRTGKRWKTETQEVGDTRGPDREEIGRVAQKRVLETEHV